MALPAGAAAGFAVLWYAARDALPAASLNFVDVIHTQTNLLGKATAIVGFLFLVAALQLVEERAGVRRVRQTAVYAAVPAFVAVLLRTNQVFYSTLLLLLTPSLQTLAERGVRGFAMPGVPRWANGRRWRFAVGASASAAFILLYTRFEAPLPEILLFGVPPLIAALLLRPRVDVLASREAAAFAVAAASLGLFRFFGDVDLDDHSRWSYFGLVQIALLHGMMVFQENEEARGTTARRRRLRF
ncbi:MAG: hypothetical protein M5R36_14980 [Deltaproteobacteria bacterium]|nr:hypothetical protein [Deltaproteobacteria bacterium]